MKQIDRLPKGYKDKVTKAKNICNSMVKSLSNCRDYNHIVETLRGFGTIDNVGGYNKVIDGKPGVHLDFDIQLTSILDMDIATYIEIVDTKIMLGNTCKIYIRDFKKFEEELVLNNYRW